MILLLILKLFGLVEYALDYLVAVQMNVAAPTAGSGGQWELKTIYLAPTTKGWAILNDVWTLVHNVMDMLAQFSTLFPLSNATGLNYGVDNTIVGFSSSAQWHP